MKHTRCTGLYFLGNTSFHVRVIVIWLWGLALPDHSAVNLAIIHADWRLDEFYDEPTHRRWSVCVCGQQCCQSYSYKMGLFATAS